MLDDERDGLDLRSYLRVLQRRKWIVLVVTLLVTAASIGASIAQTPVYLGTAEVLLQAKASETLFDPNSGAYNDPVRALETEIQVLRSRPVRDLVEERIGAAPEVTASAVGQTDVLQVQAESTDPARAALIANTYATSYIEFRRSQSVEDLLAAAEQIQQKIIDLQRQIDEVPGTTATTARTGASVPAAPVDGQQRRDSLLQQQSLFRQRLDQLQVDAALKSGGAQLVTPAVAPTTPVRPTPRRSAVVALAVGLMLGVGLALLRDHFDDSLRGKEDVERAAPGVPVLGLIPRLKAWKDRAAPVLVSLAEPQSAAAEAYRSLRTSVQFLGLDREMRIVQMTSPSEGEGKSTTIANLAVGLAGAGLRVVLLDVDLRRPRIHEFFGLDHRIGFTSILAGEVSLAAALQQVPDVPGLYLLASGPTPPNPSEMLTSNRTGDLLRSLSPHADLVLIDCPPVLPVTDARVLSHRIDGTLLVVSAGTTRQGQLRRAIELLGQVEAPLVGIIVNGVAEEAGYGYGGGYRYAASPAASESAGAEPPAGRRARNGDPRPAMEPASAPKADREPAAAPATGGPPPPPPTPSARPTPSAGSPAGDPPPFRPTPTPTPTPTPAASAPAPPAVEDAVRPAVRLTRGVDDEPPTADTPVSRLSDDRPPGDGDRDRPGAFRYPS